MKKFTKPRKMFLLFSHTLTDMQIEDAKTNLDIEIFVPLPHDLQKLWSNIPPEIDDVSCYLKPLEVYLNQEASYGDVVLIQGDFGGGYAMVNFAKKLGLLAVHATTHRDVVEKRVNNEVIKTSIFKHIKFREYL